MHLQASPAFIGGLLLLTALLLFLVMSTEFGIVFGVAAVGVIFSLVIWLWPLIGLASLILIGAIHPFVMMLLFNFTGPGPVIRLVQSWKEFVVLIVLGKVLEQTLGRRRSVRLNPLDVLAAIFLVYGSLYLFYPGTPETEDASILTKVFGLRADAFFLLAYFIGRGFLISEKKLRVLVVSFLAISFVIAVIAPIQFLAPGVTNDLFNRLGFDEYLEFQRGDTGVAYAVRQNEIPGLLIPRAPSLLLSDLALAFYMLLAVPIAGGMLIVFRHFFSRLMLNIMTLASIAATVLTVTRTTIFALVPLLLVLFFRPRGFILGMLLALELTVSGMIGAYSAGVSAGDIQQIFFAQDASVQGHMDALEDSLQIMKEAPFGRGLGTSGQVAQRLSPVTGITNESWYFQIATELGIPAMLLWIGITVALPILCFARYFQVKNPWLQSLCLGLGASMVGYAFAGMTLHAWEGLATSIIFWLLAGFAVSAPRLELEWAQQRESIQAGDAQGV